MFFTIFFYTLFYTHSCTKRAARRSPPQQLRSWWSHWRTLKSRPGPCHTRKRWWPDAMTTWPRATGRGSGRCKWGEPGHHTGRRALCVLCSFLFCFELWTQPTPDVCAQCFAGLWHNLAVLPQSREEQSSEEAGCCHCLHANRLWLSAICSS